MSSLTRPPHRPNWENLPSGDQGVYTDIILKFGGIVAFVSEENARNGGRWYARDKLKENPPTKWHAKIGHHVITHSSEEWAFPTAEAAQIACEKILKTLAQQILDTLSK